jgi:membrane protein DedA with SNARE-associated domain
VSYTENVVPPIPGDMFVVFGGYMVGAGSLNIYLVILVSTLGGAAGFMTMYAIGHRIGHVVLVPKRYRWLPENRIKRVRQLLADWGFGLVVANRFLSGLRSVISLTVGMAHMNVGRTAVFSTVSALVWTALLALVGYFLGENWEAVQVYLRNYGWFITALIVVFVVIHGIRLRRRHLRLIAEEENS